MTKLNVYIAKAGLCSRRKAAVLIKDGRVKINGQVAREPWTEVLPKDHVAVNGKPIRSENLVCLAVNKPRGVTVTLEDAHARRMISELVPKKYGRLFPVGRLDKDTRGLVIMTNDGALCHRLTHPSFEVEKEYEAVVEGHLKPGSMERMRSGVEDEGDLLKVRSVSILSRDPKKSRLKIVICEGKKRHIRRMLKQVGAKVLDLRRVRIGKLELGAMKEGKFRVIERQDI